MAAVFLFAVPILLADWQYRRIPNIYLAFILYWVAAIRIVSGIASMQSLILCVASTLFAVVILKMGVGDAKLILAISLALNLTSIADVALLFFCMYLAAVLQIIAIWGARQSIPRSIPLAFAIIFGTMLYLAAGRAPSLQQYADALVNSW
jgi:Flp pilus assembly protein protease CpaA